jgi:hypothetical protein
MDTPKHIYYQLKAAGVPMDNHESDLLVQMTPESTAIVNEYEFKQNVRTFHCQTDRTTWYEIPFAYLPYWADIAR